MLNRGNAHRRLTSALALAVAAFITGSVLSVAQTPVAPVPVARYTAVTTNLKGGPESVRIDVLAWSTDAARSQLVDAWNLIPPAPGTATRGAGTGAGGRGAAGARGARGGGAPTAGARAGNTPEAGAPETAAAAPPPTPAAPPAGRGARGARGGARGGAPVDNAGAADTPEKALAAALQSANSVGYLWTSESTGYSLRYAYRLPQPDGGERIILATDRRLGEWDGSWKPVAGGASDYAFSIIELRLNGKHEGEGKASLTGKVAVDNSSNTIALENYADVPVTLKDVKPRNAN